MYKAAKTAILIAASTVTFTLACAGPAMAADHATAEDAVAMVKKVIASIKANGREKTIADINTPNGKYIDRDLYITIGTLDGVNLGNAANPKLAGKDLSDLKDADGKFFVRDRNTALKTKPSVWVDYKWPNPVTKQIEMKSMYSERYEDLSIGAGVYKK
jgi:signal transduction histidine kinase